MNNKLAELIDRLPNVPTLAVGLWMALAPFVPEPHLVQKFLMFINNDPFKTIDIFDVFFHGGLAAIALLKLWRMMQIRNISKNRQGA